MFLQRTPLRPRATPKAPPTAPARKELSQQASQASQQPPHVKLPAIAVHTPTHPESDAKLELSALPGTPLGGPLTSGAARTGMKRVPRADLERQHLDYMRAAYAAGGETRQLLDHYARVHRYSRVRMAVYALEDSVARNVIRAISALALRLPPHPDFDPPAEHGHAPQAALDAAISLSAPQTAKA